MLITVYSLLLTAGLLLSAPWWLAPMLSTDRYREGLAERLGRVPQRLRDAVKGRQVIWVHAVSVGEVLAVSRLVEELATALGPAWIVAVSTTTRTGQTLARQRFAPERVFYFPLDFGFAVRAYVRALRPALVVLAESELWPRLLYECERAGVPVAVVNARLSDRSFRRALRAKRLWSTLLGRVRLWLAQSEADAARLLALKGPGAEIRVSGNLKYDVRPPRESALPGWIREAAGLRPVIVAGSTTDDAKGAHGEWEESLVIRAWQGAVRHEHGALLVLAPRHPERFGLIESLIREFAYARASDWIATGRGTPPWAEAATEAPPRNDYGLTPWRGPNNFVPGHKGRLDIVLLDTIGDLAAVYGVADIAFVGGSLVRRGGHNPLEPAQFGVPIVMGPSFENFREIVAKLQAANAIYGIEEKNGLEGALLALLNDRVAAGAMGTGARQVFERQGGATARSVAALLQLLGTAAEPPLKLTADAKGHEVPKRNKAPEAEVAP